jgi:hypothetical protein
VSGSDDSSFVSELSSDSNTIGTQTSGKRRSGAYTFRPSQRVPNSSRTNTPHLSSASFGSPGPETSANIPFAQNNGYSFMPNINSFGGSSTTSGMYGTPLSYRDNQRGYGPNSQARNWNPHMYSQPPAVPPASSSGFSGPDSSADIQFIWPGTAPGQPFPGGPSPFYNGSEPGHMSSSYNVSPHLSPYMYSSPPPPPSDPGIPPSPRGSPPAPTKRPDPEIEALKAQVKRLQMERIKREQDEEEKEIAEKIRRDIEERLSRL